MTDPFFVDPKPLEKKPEEQSNETGVELSIFQNYAKDVTAQYEAIAAAIDGIYDIEHLNSASIVVGTMLVSILMTYLNLGWGWYVVMLMIISSFYAKNVSRYKRKVRNQALIEYSKYQMDSDIESVEWFNSFLNRFWVQYEPGISQSIKDTVDLSLDYYKPTALEELRLTTFTLGSQAPRINSIKTFANTDDETLVMDWDLSFTPVDSDQFSKQEMLLRNIRNVEIVLLAKVGLVPLQVMAKEFYLSGKMRIQLKFMTGYPHIKVVDIAFLNKPDLDFVLKPLGAMDINKFGGLGEFIKETVQAQLAALMVNPVKMSFPIGEWMGAAAAGATETPIGVLRVAIFEGKGIKNVDMTGVSDPMARILIGGAEVARTKVIDNTLDPQWNEVHHVIIYKSTLTQIQDGSDELKLEVMHSNSLGSKPLGYTVSLALSKFIKLLGLPPEIPGGDVQVEMTPEEQEEMLIQWGSPFNDNESFWKKLALDKKASGSIRVGLCYFPMAPPPIVVAPVEGQPVKPVQEPVAGIVTATIHQGKELQVGENSAVECVCFVDTNEVFRTAVRKRTANPSWESRHLFFCGDISKDEVKFVLMNKGQSLGEVKVNVKDAMKSSEDWYKVFGRGGGKIRATFKFSPVDIKQLTADKLQTNRRNPIGILKIHVREAKNLANVEVMGKSDPYVKLILAGRAVGATNVQDNTLSPQWNETFYAVSYSLKEILSCEVFDWNNLAKDRPLGKIHLPLGPLIAHLKGTLTATESNQLGEFELDGLTVTPEGQTLHVCAPLYFKEEKIDEGKKSIDQLDVPKLPTKSTTFFKKGISNLGSEIKAKKVKQKGHIFFDLTLFSVDKDNVIEAIDGMDDSSMPAISVMDGDRKSLDAVPVIPSKNPNVEIVKNCKSGVLRIKVISGSFSRKCRAYLQILANEELLFSTVAPPKQVGKIDWHSSSDNFLPDLASSVVVFYIREQLDETPETDDPILAFWNGNFVKELLGKDQFEVPFKLYQEKHKPFDQIASFGTVKLGFGFSPVKLDVELSDAHNSGILHLDILSASDLPSADSNGLSDPYAIVYINGKEIHKTKTKKKTLNPEFDEGLETEVYSRLRSTVTIEVKDFNQFTSHVTLGTCTLSLAGIKSDEVVTSKLKLDKAPKGYVTVRYMFEPRRLKKIVSVNETENRFKTEVSSLGKFGRGLTSQVSGIGKGLFSSKSKGNSIENLPVSVPEEPYKQNFVPGSIEVEEEEPIPKTELPARRPKRNLESQEGLAVTKDMQKETETMLQKKPNIDVVEATPIQPTTTSSENVKVSPSTLDASLGKQNSRHSINSVSDRASIQSHQSRIEAGDGYLIRILGARGLTAVDSGGTSDPYVKVYVVGSEKKSFYKTSSQRKTLDPSWDKESFFVSSPSSLKFAIFDKNKISSDVPLGHVILPISTVFGDLDHFDEWFKIQQGTGTLHISGEISAGKPSSKKGLFSGRSRRISGASK